MILYPKALQDMGYDMISQNMGYLPILQETFTLITSNMPVILHNINQL